MPIPQKLSYTSKSLAPFGSGVQEKNQAIPQLSDQTFAMLVLASVG